MSPAPGNGTQPDAGPALLRAVALALTGEEPLMAAPCATADEVAEALVDLGWDHIRLQSLRHRRQLDEQPWPHAVPRELLAEVGFARYDAVLKQVRSLLGVDGLVPSVHVGPKVIGAAEQRLMAERPPHHGNVG